MYGLEDEPEDTDALDDQQILARTAWGEARGEGDEGMHAVLSVIQNRLDSGIRWWGYTPRTVCLAPWQFSCWNRSDPNRPKLLQVTEKDPAFAVATGLAFAALNRSLPDIVSGADSYLRPRAGQNPKWVEGREPVAILGNHWFYKTVDWRISLSCLKSA